MCFFGYVFQWRATATLSRSHPKVKAQFEAKERKAREEAAVAEALSARTQAMEGHKRVDPNWRDTDPDVFDVKSFAAVRLSHDGIRLGMEDVNARTAKIGSSPTVYIMLKTAFEKLMRSLEVLHKIEEALYPGLGVAPADNYKIMSIAADILDLILKGSKGEHEAGTELQTLVPEWTAALESHLRSKETDVMPASSKMAAGEIKALLASAVAPIAPAELAWFAAYSAKYLDAKRPFGNIRMYTAAIQAVTSAEAWAICVPQLERAISTENWTKIQAFLV